MTLGHEISGVVDAVGPDVNGLAVSDHVTIQPILNDGTCYACSLGRLNLCARQGFYGLSKSTMCNSAEVRVSEALI